MKRYSRDTEKIYRAIRRQRTTTRQILAEALRRAFAVDSVSLRPPFDSVQVNEVELGISSYRVPCRVFYPPLIRAPLVLYLHGGGFCVGSSHAYERMQRKLSVQTGRVIVSPEYRLAPEHPFPAALEDCLRVYHSLLQGEAARIGGEWGHFAVGGDSSGGNLALALALYLRDHREKLPRALFALCPPTDFFCEKYPSYQQRAFDDWVIDAAAMGAFRGSYAPCGTWQNPYVSPMYAELQGLPPLCLITAGLDPLLDDNRLFAQKYAAANPDTVFYVHDDVPHAFYCFTDLVPAEQQTIDQLAAFLHRHSG